VNGVSPQSHPELQALALYSTSDLDWMDRIRIRRHVSKCPSCHDHVRRFRLAIERFKLSARAEALPGFASDWSRLEREMIGNIAVGVAAARCIDNVGRRRLFSRGALVTAGLTLLFAAGWATHIPKEQNEHLLASLRQAVGIRSGRAPATVLETTSNGIAVKAQGATLTLMHPASAVVSLAGSSAVTARYVDQETGQVTITKVYAQ
jgi:hypothetical protein